MCFNKITDDKVRRALNRELLFIFAGISAVYTFISYTINPVHILETDVAVIKKSISVIEGNHLTHIQKDIKDINCDIVKIKETQSKHAEISAGNSEKLDLVIKLMK